MEFGTRHSIKSPQTVFGPTERAGQGALKAIVLDFDGVILESVAIKTEAFRQLFQEHTDHLERIVQLHRDNTGISRHEKFGIIYRDYLRKPLSEEEATRLDRAFSDLIFTDVVSCSFVPGAEAFLAHAHPRWPLFVVSGTPHDELLEIVRLRGLSRYFHGMYGSPQPKQVILQAILAENHWLPVEVIFVGDSLSDLHAAQSVGIPFIGRVPAVASNPFPSSVRWIVSDLDDLARRWQVIISSLS